MPASKNSSTNFSAESGVSVAGLIIIAFPPAIAGPALWQTRCKGKLNGLIPATIPHGTRTVNPSLFFTPGAPSSGIVSPVIRFASSAERAMISDARVDSPVASAKIFPSSRVITSASSSARSTIKSATFRKISYRSYPVKPAIIFAPRSAV